MKEKQQIDEDYIKFYVLVTKIRKKNLDRGISSAEYLNDWINHSIERLTRVGMEAAEAKKIIQEASEYDPEF